MNQQLEVAVGYAPSQTSNPMGFPTASSHQQLARTTRPILSYLGSDVKASPGLETPCLGQKP